jgi:type I restriction enzyme S subunit
LSSEQKALEGFDEKKEKDEKVEWEKRELSEVAEINPGSINDDSFNFDEIKYLDISSVGKGFIEELSDYSLEEAPSRAKRTVKEGDTVLSRVRPIREQFTLLRNPPDNLVVSTGFAVLRAKEGIDDRFLYYASTTPEMIRWMDNHTSGSAYPAVNLSTLKHAEISIPPMPVQKKIGRVLHHIDSKIETNNHINEILEEMAQTLFKSWFVDFEPYEDFKDSEIGEIPEDFEEKELGEVLSLEYGDGLSKDDRDGGRYPVYGSNGANGGHSEYLVEGPGIIVGRKGTIGTVNYEPENFWCIDTTFYIEPKEDFDMLFYYHLLKNGVALKHLGSDSAVPGLNRNIAHDQKVAIPPKEEVERFVETIKPLYEKKQDIKEENEHLEDMRDTLLPKLMSGEIRVNVDGDE